MPKNESLDTSAPAEWKSMGDIVSYTGKTVPWLGDQVQKAMNRTLTQREIDRVGEVIGAIAHDLADFSSELSELYVQTPDFLRLLEQILIRVADERQEEKRNIYRAFLSDAITSPCDPFDKQLHFLQTLRELRLDQMRLLRALAAPPDKNVHYSLSPLQVLQQRLPGIHGERIKGLLEQMNEMGVIRLADLETTKDSVSQRLEKCLTATGQQLLRFIGNKV